MYRTNGPTKSVFKDFNEEGTESLQEWHDVFIEIGDPTEYKAAIALVGEWREWERFKREWPGFNKILKQWHSELEVKIRSNALTTIINNAKKDGASARFLAKGTWKSEQSKKKEQEIKQKVEDKLEPEVARVLEAIPLESA